MLKDSQNGLCAICGGPETSMREGKPKEFAIDHDHASGKVRGLLCHPCNTGLGGFKDNPAALLAAVKYLERHR